MAITPFARTFDSFSGLIGNGSPNTVQSLLSMRSVAGTIKRIDIFSGNDLTDFPAIFNVRKNGAQMFTGGNRPSIAVGQQITSKTDLNIAVNLGDKLTLDLESYPKIPAMTPIWWTVWIDDGVNAAVDAATLGGVIAGATAKNPPTDADKFGFIDSAAGNILKSFSWLNLKTALKAVFDAIYVTGALSATDSAIALFDGTSGELIKDSGKTLSTDGAFASNSDAKIPTEKAVKTYVDNNAGGAGLPSQTGNAGKYLQTDGTAASWETVIVGGVASSGAFLIVPPGEAADYDDTNLTEAVAVNRASSIVISAVGESAKHIQTLLTEVPATQFFAELGFRGRLNPANQYSTFGLVLFDEASNKSVTFGWQFNASNLAIQTWTDFVYTSPDTFVVQTPSEWNIAREFNFLRVVNSNSNRLFQVSYDGEFWRTVYTGTANAFITPTHCGFFVGSGDGNQIVISSFNLGAI